MGAQEFISQPPIEAFDEGVLYRLAWGNVMPIHLAPIRPLQDGVAGEFAAVTPSEACVERGVDQLRSPNQAKQVV